MGILSNLDVMTKRNFSESSISTEINSEMVPATSVQLV